MGNSSSRIMIPHVLRLIYDNSPLVRVAAIWALGKLSKKIFNFEKNKNFRNENENDVRNEWILMHNELEGGFKNK